MLSPAPPRGGVAAAGRGAAAGYRTRRALVGAEPSRSGTRGTHRTLSTAQDPAGPGTFRQGYGGRSGRPTPARRLRLRPFPRPGPPSAAGLRDRSGNCRPSVDPESPPACRGRARPAAERVCARTEQVRRGGGDGSLVPRPAFPPATPFRLTSRLLAPRRRALPVTLAFRAWLGRCGVLALGLPPWVVLVDLTVRVALCCWPFVLTSGRKG